ncbi:NADH:flavin oxidoreductase/NADH oxidase family protein [Shewanella surugensis]|uniref:NADH:flavin oxidoreductase/NADH oxidase family protein n=1 Tax=Shewanella surugensis TaxID=212020 RepID=A0ABT0LJN1_9GAMM|nr:NADH:flavin oxidoreductase/NADH oxidase family protein [Shewanella surugensis]MCL1127927.1 NADH:flavin oxidoreductase/NADH oxidase family protein [Shewanella surugensis]
MNHTVFNPLTLPNGTILPNRLAKAAMEENMAATAHLPGEHICQLYHTWAAGGTGLLITGNVMVDHRAMTGPGGIVLEENTPIAPFKAWAKAGTQNGTKMWMQINHPGRQVYAAMGGQVLSPSDIALDMGKHSQLFATPSPMTEAEIRELIQRFVCTATRAVEAGFNGIQIHAAHGYLISQFLSPLTNKRTDQWGGSLDNRARLLYQIVDAIKQRLPKHIAVAVKLNSADFQRGGFDANDALVVVKALGHLNVDLVELSGGSYESPAMQGNTADGRTLEREAYFLKFAKEIAKQAPMPIMTTGGIMRLPVAQKVLDEGVDMVGIGRALAFSPDLPNRWKTSPDFSAFLPNIKWKDKTLVALASLAITKRQLQRMGKGKAPKSNSSPVISLIADRMRLKKLTKIYRTRYAHK